MSGFAPVIGDLALLALVLGLALGLTLTLLALLTGRAALAGRAALGALALAGTYALVLAAVALASREVVLPPGAEKSVAGFDPHLHVAVAAPLEHDAEGLVIAVRLRSDARRAIQDPGFLTAELVDARGRAWPVLASDAARVRTAGAFRPFGRRLAPGESYVARLRFQPDPGAHGLRLLVRETEFPTVLTVGHENSPLHRRTFQAVAGL